MAQPVARSADPAMGQPNLAGRSAKIALAASLIVAVAAYVVGLPLWAYVAWFPAVFASIAAISWHYRRALAPLERWALEPLKRLIGVPSVAWAALTIAALLALVPVAIWLTLGLGTVALTAYFFSKHWAWKVVIDRQSSSPTASAT